MQPSLGHPSDPGRRSFLRTLATLPASLPLLGASASAQTRVGFQLGWNHPWIAYGHDFGPAWGHDGLSTNGWTHETHAATRGFTGTRVVRDPATGRGMLRIETHLIGGHPSQSNGEVQLSLIDHWPFECPGPLTPTSVNLDGALVRFALRLPRGSAGLPSAPNGLQVVFKSRGADGVWSSMYTRWENISPSWEGRIVDLIARVGAADAAYLDGGFDASRVSLIGLKLGMNAAFPGSVTEPVYLDEVVADTDPPLVFDFEQHEFERDVRAVRARAGEAFALTRVFVFCDGRASPEFEPDGAVAGLDARFFADFDALLDVADRQRIRVMPVLLDFHWCARARSIGGVQLGGHAGVIRNRALRQTLLDRALKPLLERYGNRDAIFGWDILNEPEWVIHGIPGARRDAFDLVAFSEMREFTAACAFYIHRYAPGHLVTMGSARQSWVPLWTGLGLDLYQFHWYDSFEPQERFPWRPYRQLKLDKPCIIGEVPTAGTRYSALEFLRAAVFGGYSGLLLWSYRARDRASDFCAAASSLATS